LHDKDIISGSNQKLSNYNKEKDDPNNSEKITPIKQLDHSPITISISTTTTTNNQIEKTND